MPELISEPITTYLSRGTEVTVGRMRATGPALRMAATIMHTAFSDRYVGMSEKGGQEITQQHIDDTVHPDNQGYLDQLCKRVQNSLRPDSESCYALASVAIRDQFECVGFAKFQFGGFVSYDPSVGAEITEIDVLPEFQGHGIGSALVAYGMEKAAQRFKSTTVELLVLHVNPSRHVYEHWGFEKQREDHAYLFDGGPRMQLDIMRAPLDTVRQRVGRSCQSF